MSSHSCFVPWRWYQDVSHSLRDTQPLTYSADYGSYFAGPLEFLVSGASQHIVGGGLNNITAIDYQG